MNTGYIIKNNIAYGLGGGGGDSMAQEVLASTLTQLGVPTESDASFTTINENIFVLAEQKYDEGNEDGVAQSMVGDAVASEVLSGKTFTTKNDVGITGTMVNQGAKSTSLNAGGSYTIPAGYHNGSGKITANTLASQTSATAVAAEISSGKTAWVNGVKITGTRPAAITSQTATFNTGEMRNFDKMIVFPTAFDKVPTVKISCSYSQGADYYDYTVSEISRTSFNFHIHSNASHTISVAVTWLAEA